MSLTITAFTFDPISTNIYNNVNIIKYIITDMLINNNTHFKNYFSAIPNFAACITGHIAVKKHFKTLHLLHN